MSQPERIDGSTRAGLAAGLEGGRRLRVAVVQRVLAHYRVPLFRRLAREVDLEVLCTRCTPDEDAAGELTRGPPLAVRTFRTLELTRRERGVWLRPALLRHLRAQRPDVVVFELSLSLLPELAAAVALRTSARTANVLWGSGWQPPEPGWLRQLRTGMHRRLVRASDGAIAYSAVAAQWFQDLGAAHVTVAANSIDDEAAADFLRRSSAEPAQVERARRELGVEGPYVLHVGSIKPGKRLDLLLSAWAQVERVHPSLTLVVAGGGERPAAAPGGGPQRVRWLGPVFEPFQVNALFHGATCFVMPGTGGLAMHQAMALGRPVVVSTADGTERDLLVHDETGLSFPPGDADGLAAALLRLLGDAPLRERLGRNARAHVEAGYNMGRMAAAFLSALRGAYQRRAAL